MGKDTFVNVSGINLRYKELNKGASRPLVMFNGTALNYETWKPLSSRLDRHMIMIDLPGCGGSDIYKSPPSMDKYVSDMMLAVYTIHNDPIATYDVMGYSFGGVLAQAFTQKYPTFVNRLVLLSTTPGLSGQIPSYKALMMSMTFGKALWARIFGRKSDDGDVVKNFRAPNALGPLYSTGALILWSKGGRVVNDKHEALIIHGEDDHLLPVKNGYVLGELFPSGESYMIPGADHLAPLVHAEECATIINNFLEE